MLCRVAAVVVVVLGFYVSPTAKVIRRRDLGLKSHPKDCVAAVKGLPELIYSEDCVLLLVL